MNQISTNLIDDFNDLQSKIFDATNKDTIWFFTSVISRNYYKSNLFLYCSYLIFIKEVLTNNSKIKKIIVPSVLFKNIISKHIISINNGIVISTSSNKNIISVLNNFKWRYFGVFYCLKYCFKLFITGNRKRIINIYNLKELKLVDTFMFNDSIKNKKYIDRNYIDMLNYIDDLEHKSIYFVPHILAEYNSSDLDSIYKNSKENIFFKQDVLTFKDYANSIYSILRMGNIINKPILFRGFDISPLIRDEIYKKKYSSIAGVLNYYFIRRLKKESINIDLFIDWFENQQIDKGLNLGIRTFFPNSKHIGYKGYNTDTFLFFQNPTKFEADNNLTPKILAVLGKGHISFNKKFYKNQNVSVIGGFRYQNLINYKRNYNDSINGKNILIVLPIDLRESIEVLKTIIEAKNKINMNISYHIKPHPALDINFINKELPVNWSKNFVINNGSFLDSLMNMNLVIGTGTTSCMESIAMGIPTIILGSQSSLTNNPIPSSINKKIWSLVYNSNELSKHIVDYLTLNDIQLRDLSIIGEKIKEDYFEKITKEKISQLFNL